MTILLNNDIVRTATQAVVAKMRMFVTGAIEYGVEIVLLDLEKKVYCEGSSIWLILNQAQKGLPPLKEPLTTLMNRLLIDKELFLGQPNVDSVPSTSLVNQLLIGEKKEVREHKKKVKTTKKKGSRKDASDSSSSSSDSNSESGSDSSSDDAKGKRGRSSQRGKKSEKKRKTGRAAHSRERKGSRERRSSREREKKRDRSRSPARQRSPRGKRLKTLKSSVKGIKCGKCTGRGHKDSQCPGNVFAGPGTCFICGGLKHAMKHCTSPWEWDR